MARLPRKGDLQQVDKYLGDITQKLDQIGKMKDVFAGPATNAKEHLANVAKLSEDWAAQLDRVSKSAAGTNTALGFIARQSLASLVSGFDKLGKAIVKSGLNSFQAGLDGLEGGIKKVYD